MNFYSGYLKSTKQKNTIIRALILGVAIVAAILSVVMATYSVYITALENEVETHRRFINEEATREALARYEILNDSISEMQAVVDDMKSYSDMIYSTTWISTEMFKDISSVMSLGMHMLTISVTDNIVRIQGVSPTRNAVAIYQHRLKNLDRIHDVHVFAINRIEETDMFSFDLEIYLNSRVRYVSGGDDSEA